MGGLGEAEEGGAGRKSLSSRWTLEDQMSTILSRVWFRLMIIVDTIEY